tara:strand:+ start:108 stop:731 length:624 start_codon:yes stop_codon:yes gene_type:complete
MALPTTPTTAQLDAVNEMLMSVGQTPVTQLEATNPDVALAFETLTQVSRGVQAEGWTFNRENHLSTFVPDSTTKKIQIPDNVLQIDLSDNHDNRSKDAVRRDGYLYDRENHTFEWDSTPEVDVVYFYDWGDLPKPIRDYVVARAAAIFSSRIVGDPTQFQLLSQREAYARAQALEYECNQGDYTYFGHPDGGNFYNSYQPYTALYRY